MIVQNIYIKDWDWKVVVFYAVTTYYLDEILDELEKIGCSRRKLKEIEKSLSTEQYDIGFTYSNVKNRCSVLVIGLTSSPAEFQNTFDHEKGHLAMHICETDHIDPFQKNINISQEKLVELCFQLLKISFAFIVELD